MELPAYLTHLPRYVEIDSSEQKSHRGIRGVPYDFFHRMQWPQSSSNVIKTHPVRTSRHREPERCLIDSLYNHRSDRAL